MYALTITGLFVWTLCSLWMPLIMIHIELVEYTIQYGYVWGHIYALSDFLDFWFFSFKSEPNPNLADLMISSILAVWMIILILLTCEFGERLTNQYEIFYYEFGQCNWYLFPFEIQQVLPIIISNIQRPVMIRGYANTVCRREAGKTVTFFTISCIFFFVYFWAIANRLKYLPFFFLYLDDKKSIFLLYDASPSWWIKLKVKHIFFTRILSTVLAIKSTLHAKTTVST